MLAPLVLEPITVAARCVHRIEDARGKKVSCVRGAAWVTQENDRRDLILASGQSVVLDRPGVAVVYAFQDAVITVGPGWQLPVAANASVPSIPERACA
jgi:hypothetical protein